MRSGVTTAIIGVLVLTAALPAPAEEKSQAKKKILVLTFCEGFKHSSLEICEQTLAKIGKESGVFEADCLNMWRLKPEEIDLSFLTKEKMNQYDAIFFYTSSNKDAKDKDLLTEEQRQAFLEYIKAGHAFIGSHSVSDTFYHWKEFGDICGAYFVNHPWGADSAPVTIKVEDKAHPATQMLGGSWTIQDEIYQFKEPYSREKLHVLLSLDTSRTDMKKEGLLYGPTGDYAVAWCHEYGKGRCFYSSLGHREDVWTNPVFQAHLLGGIKWALGVSGGAKAQDSGIARAESSPKGFSLEQGKRCCGGLSGMLLPHRPPLCQDFTPSAWNHPFHHRQWCPFAY